MQSRYFAPDHDMRLPDCKVTKIIAFLFFLCLTGTPLYSIAQTQLLSEFFEDYLDRSGRLMEFDNVPVEWKMEGVVQADFNEGLNNLLEQHPMVAEAEFTKVIRRDSLLWQAYYYRGICRKQMNSLADAQKDIRAAIKLGGDFYEGLIELGKLEQLRYNLAEAEKRFNKAIRFAPSNALGYYLKANLNWRNGLQKETVRNLKTTVSRDSLFHDAWLKLAIIDIVNPKHIDVGRRKLDRVLQNDSMNRDALFFRAIVQFESNREQALKDLNNLLIASPDNISALFFRGLLQSKLEHYNRAFSDFHKVIDITAADDNTFKGQQTVLDKKIDIQNAGAYTISRVYGLSEDDAMLIKKAYCLIVLGSYTDAYNTLEQVSGCKHEPLCVYLKAVANEHGGKHNDAFNLYNEALLLDNEILDAHKKKGIYQQELKNWYQSVQSFNEVLRINPATFVVFKIRGVSYYHLNEFQKSVDDFTLYLQRDSLDKQIISYRAMARLKAGHYLDACVDFATSKNFQYLNYTKMLGSVDSLMQLDSAKAFSYLQALTKKDPNFTEGFVRKYQVLKHRNQWNEIEKDIDIAAQRTRFNASKEHIAYILMLKGVSAARASKYEDAIATLNQSIKFDKHNASAFLERGRVLMAMKKNGKAVADLKKALSLGSSEAGALLSSLN